MSALNGTLIPLLFAFLLVQSLLLIFRVWSRRLYYQAQKPFLWQQARQVGEISADLLKLEQRVRDKVRFYNFWLQIERLKNEEIPGAFAELGVYRGETAEILHALDPGRKFHLFDTFTGFQKQDLDREQTFGKNYRVGQFADTRLETVQKKLSDPQYLFHPGYFPATTVGIPEGETFALVHIDADLYWPTLQACQYFYPRLSPGGVMIIHDYHHCWPGIQEAVDEFAQAHQLLRIPVADQQGSVMLFKAIQI
jgi:O-methyltransferase